MKLNNSLLKNAFKLTIFEKFKPFLLFDCFRCTESFNVKSAEISIFGIPLWYKSNTPRTVISPTVQPGECWSFQGFPGYLVLKLNNNVYVTGFTMEHIPKSLAPNGRIDSAPKFFTVWVNVQFFNTFISSLRNDLVKNIDSRSDVGIICHCYNFRI